MSSEIKIIELPKKEFADNTQIISRRNKIRFHTCGDSHSIIDFNGLKINGVSWRPHHIGSRLMYRFGRGIFSILDLRDYKDICDGDYVCFCFGEIDCRCHIFKHINNEKTYKQIIEQLVCNYFKAIKENINNFKDLKVCVYNIVPMVMKSTIIQNKSFPCLGEDEDRKNYAIYMNKLLKEKCMEYKYYFIDVYNKYCDEKGYLNKKYSDNNVHIQNNIFIRDEVEKIILQKN